MAVEVYERSAFSGKPVQLYEFIRTSDGTDYRWLYNSSDRDLTYLSVVWEAIPISDDGIKLSSEAVSTDLVVTMPISEPFCEQFRLNGTTPSDTVWLRIRRVHGGDIEGIDSGQAIIRNDALITWIGTVNGINQTSELEAKVRCSMLSASLKRGGLRYGYQKNCPHVLYASNTCKVDKEAFRVAGQVVSITGSMINTAEFALFPVGWFNGGFIEYNLISGVLERRIILTHAGGNVSIMGLPVGISIGDIVYAFPGCDRTVATCVAKFNNLANMGGFPHSPGRNPFDGQPVF